MVHGFVTSRLDAHNSLLLGLPKGELQKLQLVQNNAARFITGTPRDHRTTLSTEVTPLAANSPESRLQSAPSHIQGASLAEPSVSDGALPLLLDRP